MRERKLIAALIDGVDVPPIARDMPPEKYAGRLARHEQCVQGTRRRHYLAEGEAGNHTDARKPASLAVAR